MIILKSLKFRSPEGSGGGGADTEEPPALSNIGEDYKKALAAQKPESAKVELPPTGVTGVAATGATGATGVKDGPGPTGVTGVTGVKEAVKPASALDAVLEDAGVTGATGVQDAQFESVLKDIPEVLPKEGRKDHWEKARGAIGKLETTVATDRKTIAQLTRDLETAKMTPPEAVGRVAELEKELAEYKDAIVAINVEYSPEHTKKFVEGRKGLVAKAAAKLNAFGGKGELIESALAMDEGRGRTQAIKEALAELEPVEQNRVLQFVTEVEKLDDEKAEIMKDPQGAWAKLQESEKTKALATAKRHEEFKKTMFDKVSVELPKTHLLLREVDPALPDAAEHNGKVKEMKDAAFALLGPDAKPEDLIEAAFAKQELPRLQELFKGKMKELVTALALVKEYEAASPGFRGGKAPIESEEEQKLKKSPGQIYQESLRKQSGQE